MMSQEKNFWHTNLIIQFIVFVLLVHSSLAILTSLLFLGPPKLHSCTRTFAWAIPPAFAPPFFSFLVAPQHMEFPSQQSDLRCGCDLSCSCGNTRVLTHCTRIGIEPVSQPSQVAPISALYFPLPAWICCFPCL